MKSGQFWACVRRARTLAVTLALPLLAAAVLGTGTSKEARFLEAAVLVVSREEALASPPQVLERRFWSAALGREMPYAIYLPPGYESSNARYPVLYMLHGLGGTYHQWERSRLMPAATDLIERGVIPPMIIVMPEGERGYWVDHVGEGPRYGSYVRHDLVSFIDGAYRTIPLRRARAIGGLSMGAHGALDIALNNPGEFGIVGAHSLALRKREDALQFFGNEQNWAAHDPRTLCHIRRNAIRRADLELWLDIGTSDPWASGTTAFHDQLDAAGIEHVWRKWDGGHDSTYWDAHATDYLRFYGDAFREDLAL